jgi:hypothetical protein
MRSAAPPASQRIVDGCRTQSLGGRKPSTLDWPVRLRPPKDLGF